VLINYIKKISFLFFIFTFSTQHIYAIPIHTKEIVTLSKNIANTSKIFLVNFALDELQNKIKLDMENKNIRAIVINDIFLDTDILVTYKDENNNIYFSKELPSTYKKYTQIRQDIVQKKSYTNTIIGFVTVYYDDIYIDNVISFSKEELKYLENKKVIKMCIDPSWMPFEMISNDRHIGITSDYAKIFSKKINTKIIIVPTNSWIESLEKAKNRECDILSLVSKTKNREQYMDFTSPYIITPIVIATKIGIPFIDDISYVLDKKLGVVKGYSINETLRDKYPNINLVEVDSIKDGLNKVEKKEIFGYIDNTIVINHEIQQNFIGTITVSGKLNDNVQLSVASRDDEKILNNIFEKVILSIGEHTKHDILTKWVKANYSIKTDYTLLLILSFISLLIILISVYWNRRLSKLNKELSIQRDKADAATKAKSEFLANMSHEIRTPMSGIMGMTALALKSNLNEQSRNYITKIDLSAKSLLHIVNDILDFSKIEAGKLEIEKVDFNLTQLIDSVVNMIGFKADEKNIKIIVSYSADLEKNIYADSLRISQVLINLMSNAVKFTSNGEVSLNITKNNNLYRFEVKDTGIGIDEKHQKNLFLPFIQSDGRTTRKYGGTGLGLSISKQLVKLMGGKIWVESQKDIGSSFIFELDIKVSKRAPACILNQQKDFVSNIKIIENLHILLVEDNKINQEIVVGLLDESNIVIDIANNGKEAVEKFNENRYDLIFMDIQMPIMDGYEAAKIIRKKEKECAVSSQHSANIPIIALSANVMKNDIEKSKDAGMNEHLNKPLEIEKLYNTILKYVSFKDDNKRLNKDEVTIPDFINLDVKSALVYLGGNKILYLKILNDFKENYKNLKIQELSDEEFSRVIHTLKGLSANIGAIELNKIVLELDKKYDEKLIVEFNKELELVLNELKDLNLINSNIEKPSLILEKEKRDELFLELKEAIKSKRPKKYIPIIEDIEKYKLSKNDEELFQKIKKYIKKYQFKDVLLILDELCETL